MRTIDETESGEGPGMASDSEAGAPASTRADNRLRGPGAMLSFHTPTASYGQAELAHGALLQASLDCLEGDGPS